MTERASPKLAKGPFILADVLLCAVAGYILHRIGTPESTGEIVLAGLCLAAGALAAWLAVTPYILEFRAAEKQSESETVHSAVEKIQQLEQIGARIETANVHWQTAVDSSSKVVQASKEIADRMTAESKEFRVFLQNAHEHEKNQLKLEVEKLRRSETEWIQVLVRTLDHIFALTQAGARSGQPNLVAQLQQFQLACRDISRRVGLAPFVPEPNEPFNDKSHQLLDPASELPPNPRILETIATGFTFQGQLLRKAIVALVPPDSGASKTADAGPAVKNDLPKDEDPNIPETASSRLHPKVPAFLSDAPPGSGAPGDAQPRIPEPGPALAEVSSTQPSAASATPSTLPLAGASPRSRQKVKATRVLVDQAGSEFADAQASLPL